MLYTAKLTGNRRDIQTGSPKALLININPDNDGLFRDHCWVELTPEIEAMQPEGHKKPLLIGFEAKVKKYIKRGTEVAYTLHNITDITRI